MLYRSTGTCADQGPVAEEDPNLPIHTEAVKSNGRSLKVVRPVIGVPDSCADRFPADACLRL